MVVRSFNTEMGYEGIATIPYAYALHLQGKLSATISGDGSESFYYFSPKHIIDPSQRDWEHTHKAANHIPNMWIHRSRLDKSNWVPPPYKKHYGPLAIKFSKPTVVIYNRYNHEWGKPPINYFDLNTLRRLFAMLSPKYDIVYFNIRGQEKLEDNAHSMELGDYDMIREEFPNVHIIHDIVESSGLSYNEAQLRVFAGCERFITMNGFPSILASYFGGENIIYSKYCRELRSDVNSFYNWYPDFGNSVVKVVNTMDELISIIESKWVREDPLINILVRCHKRKEGLNRLYGSIKNQEYINWNIIASYDNEDDWKYLCGMPFHKVRVFPIDSEPSRPIDPNYRGFMPANLYLNELAKRVTKGIVIYMDDDDYMLPGSLKKIAGMDVGKVLLWRAYHDETKKLIPSNNNWGSIIAGDISGIAFAYHSKHVSLVNWEPWRRGDYRVIKRLNEAIGSVWLDDVLTAIGKRPPERTTLEWREAMAIKKEARALEINKIVREKLSQKKMPANRLNTSTGQQVCSCCGQRMPSKHNK